MAKVIFQGSTLVSGTGTQNVDIDTGSLNGQNFADSNSAMWVRAIAINKESSASYRGPAKKEAWYEHDSTTLTLIDEGSQSGLLAANLSITFSASGDNIRIGVASDGGVRSLLCNVYYEIWAFD